MAKPKQRPRPAETTSPRSAGRNSKKPVSSGLVRPAPVKKSASLDVASLSPPSAPVVARPPRWRSWLQRAWLQRAELRYAAIAVTALVLGGLLGYGLRASHPGAPTATAAVIESPAPAAADKTVAAAPDVTGSITPPAPAATPATPPAPPRQMVDGLPVIPTWKVLDIQGRVATVEGHDEVFKVRVGSLLQGGGKITEFRRDGDRWLVITTAGVVLPRGAKP